MEMEEKLISQRKNKRFLLEIKYIMHFLGINYIIYTLFQFIGIDLWPINYIATVSILTGYVLYKISKKFHFCYVHRLPLYYILVNQVLTIIDYYIGIPISVFYLLMVHLLLIALLIFGYTYYYINFKLK